MPEPSQPPRPKTFLGRVLRLTGLLEDGILVGLLTTMIALAVTQIVLRNLFSSGILWGDAFLRVLVLWVGLLGAMAATRDDKQITIDVLSKILPKRWTAATRIITDLFTTVVSAAVAWASWRLVQMEREFPTPAFADVPTWVCQLVLPVAFAMIAVRYAAYSVIHLREALIPGVSGTSGIPGKNDQDDEETA